MLQEISCLQNLLDTNFINVKSIDSRKPYMKGLKEKHFYRCFMLVLNLIYTFCLVSVVCQF